MEMPQAQVPSDLREVQYPLGWTIGGRQRERSRPAQRQSSMVVYSLRNGFISKFPERQLENSNRGTTTKAPRVRARPPSPVKLPSRNVAFCVREELATFRESLSRFYTSRKRRCIMPDLWVVETVTREQSIERLKRVPISNNSRILLRLKTLPEILTQWAPQTKASVVISISEIQLVLFPL